MAWLASLFGGSGIVAYLAVAVAGAAILGAAVFFIYQQGEDAAIGRAATEAVEQVQDNIKARDEVDAEVRDDNRGKPVSDGLRPFYRD